MISFLNSILLPALAAAVIPLLIHFFNRQKTKKIEFSSLRFLKLLESKRIRQVKLYQILLIILRTLFILFIVLAFTRPTITGDLPSITTPANTTAVMILDDSYSMRSYAGSTTRFEQALLHMKEQISLFSHDDRVFFITPAKITTPVHVNTQEISQLAEPTFLSPDFTNVLRNASEIFEKYPNYNKELYIYSDFQISREALHDSINSFSVIKP
ncbi:MAG: BatA domain-containing protein [Calditrichaceae bacterium]